MIKVKGSVNIKANADQVFSLISDVRQCAELNPRIEVISIGIAPSGKLSEGAMIHYRIVVKGRMTEYASNVLAFDPPRRLETETETEPKIRISVNVEEIPGGSRLTQEMSASITQQEPIQVNLPRWFARLMGRLEKETNAEEYTEKILKQQELEMQQQLQGQMDEWLAIVKKHLEEQRDTFMA